MWGVTGVWGVWAYAELEVGRPHQRRERLSRVEDEQHRVQLAAHLRAHGDASAHVGRPSYTPEASRTPCGDVQRASLRWFDIKGWNLRGVRGATRRGAN